MAVLYANRIIREKLNGALNPFTIENVPGYAKKNGWYQSTLDELASRGYDGYGNKL